MRHTSEVSAIFVAVLLALVSGGATVVAQTPTPAVVATFQIPDADIVGLSVSSSGELAVYDRTPLTSNAVLRFFVASLEEGQVVVTEALESVTLVGEAPGFMGWMLHDGDLLYALSVNHRSTEYGLSSWDEMRLYVIAGRSTISAIRFNDTLVVTGDEPWATPEDFRYSVSGFTLKPAGAEDGNNPRIIIDDTLKGNLDILDLDVSGTALASQVRHSYRARYENGCQWPDIDPGPWYCSYSGLIGNGLALEWTLDTRTSPSDPTLISDDDLYLLDPIYSHSKLRRIKLSHPGVTFSATPQTEIDLEIADWFLANGVESLHAAPSTDRIWIATGLQSFDEGYVPVLDTLHLTTQVIDPIYSDEDLLMVDPGNHRRVFIPVADAFAGATTDLIVRELVDGVVVNSVLSLTGYDKYSLTAAAFDRAFGLVYLAIDDTIYAVAVTSPNPPWIFEDGFESGDPSRWTSTQP